MRWILLVGSLLAGSANGAESQFSYAGFEMGTTKDAAKLDIGSRYIIQDRGPFLLLTRTRGGLPVETFQLIFSCKERLTGIVHNPDTRSPLEDFVAISDEVSRIFTNPGVYTTETEYLSDGIGSSRTVRVAWEERKLQAVLSASTFQNASPGINLMFDYSKRICE